MGLFITSSAQLKLNGHTEGIIDGGDGHSHPSGGGRFKTGVLKCLKLLLQWCTTADLFRFSVGRLR